MVDFKKLREREVQIKEDTGHDFGCTCARCDGIRRHPQPTHCDWCRSVHIGDANNCPTRFDADGDSEKHSQGQSESRNSYQDSSTDRIVEGIRSRNKEITQWVKEQAEMLPQAEARGQSTSSNSGSGGGRGRQQAQRTGYPNLRTADVSFDKTVFKILGAKEPDPPNTYKNAVIVKIAYKGAIFLWNLKANNPCYGILVQELGTNENNWLEKEGYLFLEEDEFSGQHWLRVEVIKAAKSKK